MKSLFLSIVMASLVLAPATAAKSKPGQAAKPSADLLKQALAAVAATAQSGPPAKTTDGDQGDDHANPNAILKVCTKDTPAARRAAICPVGGSPN
jgi:hypothetical protein